MADSLAPTSADIARKRSRSSSPSTDSASKKANQATQAPVKLELDDDEDNSNENGGNGAEMQTDDKDAEKNDEAAPMNVDSTNPPSTSVSASVAAANPDLPANPEAANADAAAASTAAATIQMRALIVTQDASIIIGKQGKNVNEIRDKSGAKITITEAVPGNPERIMVIAGQLDAVSKVSQKSPLFPRSRLDLTFSHFFSLARLSVSSFDESTTNLSTFPRFLVPVPSLSDSLFPTLEWVQSLANPVQRSRRSKKLRELDSKRPKRCSPVQPNECSQSPEWPTLFTSPFITSELYFKNTPSLATTRVTDLEREIMDLLHRVRGEIGMGVLDLLLRVEEEERGMRRGKEEREGKVEEVEWDLQLDLVLKLSKSSFLTN